MTMARRKPLVCQFLENISRTALEEYEDIIRDFVRGCHGVYALYRRKKLYYVGLASNLRNRLTQHLRDRHGQSWDRFSVYLTIGDEHMKELESLILRIVRPRGNKEPGKFAKSENLRQELARRIRAYERQRLDELLGRIRILKLDKKSQTRRRAKLDGRQPVLARDIKEPMRLRARFKGQYCSERRSAATARFPFRRTAVQLPVARRHRRLPTPDLQRVVVLDLRTRPRRLGEAEGTAVTAKPHGSR